MIDTTSLRPLTHTGRTCISGPPRRLLCRWHSPNRPARDLPSTTTPEIVQGTRGVADADVMKRGVPPREPPMPDAGRLIFRVAPERAFRADREHQVGGVSTIHPVQWDAMGDHAARMRCR